MQQNQPKKTQLKPTTKPPLPSPSQSHKRLLVNSNPNPNFTTPSPQSSISSDSSEDDPRKKTRDLPNLYDCHSCNRHVNFSNPSDKLRILESAWRVVLLCKECNRCVELGKDCSYCLSSVSGFECFKCGNCDRLVHKECVGKYGVCPPWSYCPVEMRFKVCVDCWVPNSVKSGKGVRFEVLEDCVREAECVAGKKFEVSVKAKEDALRKRDVARKAVDYASGVLKRDGLEDGELALQLHRAMNSSSRISRSFGPVNYSCLGGGKSRKLGFFGKIKVRGDKELDKVLEARMNSENVGCENGKGLRDGGNIGMAKEGVVGICSPGVDNGKNSVLRYYQRRNKQRQMLQSVTRSAQSVDKNFQPGLKCYQRQRRNKLKRVLESEVKSTQSARDRVMLYYSRRKHDRFMSKYRRRNLGSKVVTNGQRRNLYDSLRLHEYVLALPTPSKCPTN
ncbi:hypothetical protein POM88_043784 [Heracleum sosnowskyi]|uniref:Uncharacterized protein n=1 Tax=Heracleum sosnowskyi TaxID=360622 RepID=A0AAD8M2B4_9APIA|nr:hypothetical protein POM88_043784 [Heracleum sosnowskyi]